MALSLEELGYDYCEMHEIAHKEDVVVAYSNILCELGITDVKNPLTVKAIRVIEKTNSNGCCVFTVDSSVEDHYTLQVLKELKECGYVLLSDGSDYYFVQPSKCTL